jgi:hypothetical protein
MAPAITGLALFSWSAQPPIAMLFGATTIAVLGQETLDRSVLRPLAVDLGLTVLPVKLAGI